MKDAKKVWKELARNKNVTNEETFQYCILHAMAAKHEDKEMIATYFVLRAYTAITNQNKLNNGMHPHFGLVNARKNTNKWSESPLLDCLESKEEEEIFWKLADLNYFKYDEELSKKFYTFVFVRTDISVEQQMVQVGHVMAILGNEFHKFELSLPTTFKFEELHIVLCPADNDKHLWEIITEVNRPVAKFREPDLENQLTAIATYPIAANKRRYLSRHKPLVVPRTFGVYERYYDGTKKEEQISA